MKQEQIIATSTERLTIYVLNPTLLHLLRPFLCDDGNLEDSSCIVISPLSKAMFTLYRIVKRTVAEIALAQCEQQQVLRCVADYVSL